MHFLYSLMLGGAFLLLAPFVLLVPAWREKYAPSLAARLGRVPGALRQPDKGAIWVHAVSVGEVIAIGPLVGELRQRYPHRKVLVSTTTRTGQELARLRFGEESVFYFPLDFVFACRRVLRGIRPALVIIAETEIWPNFLREAKRFGASVVLVNGRVSAKSARGYRRWKWFFRSVLSNVDLFLMQTQTDASRLHPALNGAGAGPGGIRVTGNLKFDQPPPQPAKFIPELERIAASAPIVVAGSTMPGEEDGLLEAMRACAASGARKPVLVIAPRHPERFGEVAKLLTARGVHYQRRTALEDTGRRPEVVLLDTLGELAGTYAAATVAFMGGSLLPYGGHNPIEPAMWGKPILFGPSMENFQSVASELRKAGAAFEVRSPKALGILLATLLADPGKRERAGAAARTVVEQQRGATRRSVEEISRLLDPSIGESA